ncbi:hypothetical protein Salat_0234200 [Sesamum alatum]|uniref:Uncharacterized protein n=1 Tax=Sesamum alatum TaxID=300844 RepID=A0AAE2CY74_9LAMI|nr:hypothetical protein Salat_0234200 [Sesamum alatum]
MQKDEIVVRPTLSMIEEGPKCWNTTRTLGHTIVNYLEVKKKATTPSVIVLVKKQGSKSIVDFIVEVVADCAGDVVAEVAVKTQAGVDLAGQLKLSSNNSNKRA